MKWMLFSGGGGPASPFKPENFDNILPVLKLLRDLSKKYGKTPSQIALKWLVVQRDVYPILGTKKPSYVEEAADVLNWNIEAADLEELSKVSEGVNWTIILWIFSNQQAFQRQNYVSVLTTK